MKKILSIIACTAAAVLLSGCDHGGTEANGTTSETVINSASDTVKTSQTAETSETDSQTEEEVSVTGEDIAEETDEELFAETVISEPTEESVTVTYGDNVKVYKFNDDDPPEMPEFSMNFDDLEEYYSKTDINRARMRIKAMLDCAGTGEIPMIDLNGIGELPAEQLENITVKSWQVLDEMYENYRYEVTVRLEVTESESEFITVGTDDYLIVWQPGEDRSFLPLRKVGELDETRLIPYYYCGDEKEYLDFCNSFTCYFSRLFKENVVTDFSSPDLSDYGGSGATFYSLVMIYRYSGSEVVFPMSYEDFDNALQNMLGFSADTLGVKNYDNYYDAETDTVDLPGRGLSWYCGYLADETYDEESGTRTVTIEYYEDDFHLIPSQTYRYTIRENENGSYTMLKFEKLFTSDRNILGGTV